MLLNHYIHVIEFDPPPDDYEQPRAIKRKLEADETPPKKRKSFKTDLENAIFPATENTWDDIDNGELYIFTAKGVKSSTKIAAFDMDGTLIKTKSGKVHPVDLNDWQITFPTVSQTLKKYSSEGFKIVILSNQAPIGNGRVKIEDFEKKIEAIVEKLDIPIQAFIATGKGFYRKPSIGMWKTLEEKVIGYLYIIFYFKKLKLTLFC